MRRHNRLELMCKTINNYHFNGIVFCEEVELVSSYQSSWWVIPLNYKAETLVIDNLYKKQKLSCCRIPFTVNLQTYNPNTILYWTSGGLGVASQIFYHLNCNALLCINIYSLSKLMTTSQTAILHLACNA